MSPPEVILWQRLRQRPGGFKFRRQHPAGGYVLDFFCSEARLAIEVDGFAHDTGYRPQADEMRDSWLRLRNVETLRVGASQVSRSPDQVIEWIINKCEERAGPLHQPSAGPPPRSGED
jgi:very-short-patch-repair endonuclease